jgi:hypothetical protein
LKTFTETAGTESKFQSKIGVTPNAVFLWRNGTKGIIIQAMTRTQGAIMALTDTAVRQVKATGKAYTLGDRDGLSLAVSPQGGKSWHFRYYWGDKQKRMSLGTYPEVSLREARQARDEARALLARGINPHTHRKQQRQTVHLTGEYTFESVFHQWLERHALVVRS